MTSVPVLKDGIDTRPETGSLTDMGIIDRRYGGGTYSHLVGLFRYKHYLIKRFGLYVGFLEKHV